MNTTISFRPVQKIIPALRASDGAGVRIRRSLGSSPSLRVDPFLMLDEFGSAEAADYIGGFPPHPHRGFETITYMLAGRMRHEDHLGNQGDLGPGDVQWMTAGRGIVHSEMPQQEEGLMHGFQIWLNLAARDKMKAANYRDIPASEIPETQTQDGASVKVISGEWSDGVTTLKGPAQAEATEPLYWDVSVPAGAGFTHRLPPGHNAFAYIYAGQAEISNTLVDAQNAAVLGDGDAVNVCNTGRGTLKFLLCAGRPLREPVAQYGPFVMNTHEEIQQTLRDYRDGRLTAEATTA